MTKEELKKEIENAYFWFIAEHHEKEPNVAYVKCQWDGEEFPEDIVQTIAIDSKWYDELSAENGDEYVVPYIKDEDVLYYCSGIDSLLDLIEPNIANDFVITDFIGFEYLKWEKNNENQV